MIFSIPAFLGRRPKKAIDALAIEIGFIGDREMHISSGLPYHYARAKCPSFFAGKLPKTGGIKKRVANYACLLLYTFTKLFFKSMKMHIAAGAEYSWLCYLVRSYAFCFVFTKYTYTHLQTEFCC